MMRILVLFLLLALPLDAAETAPAPPPSASVLVVDVKRVLDESKAAVGAQKKIETARSAFQVEISNKEKAIREAEQDLLQQRSKLNQQQFAEKEGQLRQKFRDVEKYVQERRQALEQATTRSMGKVREVLLDIVKDIAKKRGSPAVLVKQQALWVQPSLEITDEVLERLNATLPDLPVAVERPASKP